MKTALIAGATGLIGNQLLRLLLADEHYTVVKAITRRPLDISDPKLINIVINFEKLSDVSPQLKADDVFCCLGTTIKQAGSKEAFKKADHDYPLKIAHLAKDMGARQYFLVSALGANARSSIFYNSVKGQVEKAVEDVGYESLHIFRPSLLLGDRVEKRSGEQAARVFYRFFGKLFPAKYQAIDSAKVANAMLQLAHQAKKGLFIHESGSLQAF